MRAGLRVLCVFVVKVEPRRHGKDTKSFSNLNRPLVDRAARPPSRLGQGRMGMAGAARSSAEPPNSISTAASAISSPAPADDMDAEHAVGRRIGENFTKPSVRRIALARPLAVKGNLPA